MEILLGKTAGFCYGVKKAVDGANELIEKNAEKSYCLGEIVHNNEVIKSLKDKGLEFIDDISYAKGKTIIRAHGITKNTYDEAKKNNIELEDYTCPNVIKIHKIAEEYADDGWFIFLTGSKNHPENIGTISYCGENYYVIEKEEDVEDAIKQFEKTKINRLLLISQTTYSLERFEKIEEKIKDLINQDVNLVIKNTICTSTKIRQKETEDLAKQVDCMIIIGGKNSSNTKKLFEIASKYCKQSICIENVQELNLNDIKNAEKIGIMAGASTPKESIERVIEKISTGF